MKREAQLQSDYLYRFIFKICADSIKNIRQ